MACEGYGLWSIAEGVDPDFMLRTIKTHEDMKLAVKMGDYTQMPGMVLQPLSSTASSPPQYTASSNNVPAPTPAPARQAADVGHVDIASLPGFECLRDK